MTTRQSLRAPCAVGTAGYAGRLPLAHAGRLLRGASRAAAAAARRGLASAAPGSLYETLGISCGEHDAAQIKLAFRRRAQLVHPDVARPGADAAAFVQLVHAYETLSCPTRRALYDATLGDGGGGGWRAAAASAAAAGDAEASEEGAERDGRRSSGRAVVRDRRLELNDALARAYHGPAVDLGAAASGVLPPCFEGDERAEPHEGDLMQLCSGRTLLGVVRHVVLTALEGGGTKHTLAVADDTAGLVTPLVDELWLLSHTGKLVASARRSPRAPPEAGRRASPWQPYVDDGAGAGSIDVFLHERDDGVPQLHCRVSAAGGGYGFGSVEDPDGRMVCSVFLHSTAFVTNLHFFATNGAFAAMCTQL